MTVSVVGPTLNPGQRVHLRSHASRQNLRLEHGSINARGGDGLRDLATVVEFFRTLFTGPLATWIVSPSNGHVRFQNVVCLTTRAFFSRFLKSSY